MSYFLFMTIISVTTIPMAIPCMITLGESMSILGIPLLIVFFMIFSFGIAVPVNLIMKPLTKNIVTVDNEELSYKGARLRLDEIKYITLYLPKASQTSSSPQELSIWINDNDSAVIKRPALTLIHMLKKRCPNAKFEIDELRSKIRFVLIMGICSFAVGLIISIIAI